MSTGLRGDPSNLDVEWLTDGLEAAGVARGARVTGVELAGFIGTGQMGRNARFRLTWDDPTGRPATVVGKFPTDDATARASAFANGNYVKEWLFYAQLRPTVTIRVPDVWIAHFDDTSQDFAFIMEDLAGSAQGDQMRGLDRREAALAVEQLVGLHAPHWGDDELSVLLGGMTKEEGAARLAMIYQLTVEGALARHSYRLDAEAIQFVHDLTPLVERWAMGTDTPSTLVHMDYRPDNFLFAAQAGAPPLVVVDWQTISYGLGASDLAYMIGGSFEAEERRAVEGELVEEYRTLLEAAGVEYAADACWRDYRHGSIWGVVMSILATMLAEQTERGDEMLWTMLRRHARHAIDLDALALLR